MSRFVGDSSEDTACDAAAALRAALGQGDKAIAVLDAEDVHLYDLVRPLRDIRVQVVIVLRSAFARGLETALELEQAHGELDESSESGIRVLAAQWGDNRFPSLALVGVGSSESSYRLVTGHSGKAGSSLSFTALVDADQDLAAEVDAWFLQVWNHSTELDELRELEQPVFGRAAPEVVAELASRWGQFVEDVRAEPAPATVQHAGPLPIAAERHEAESSADIIDATTSWTLFPLESGAADDDEGGGSESPIAANGRTSILAVQSSSSLDRDLREIYARGALVSVHTSHKVPTFRFDVNAVLGISERARSGRASLSSPIRLDLLPQTVKEEIGRVKRYASNLLQSHSILLAENNHWMPRAALPHFEAALKLRTESTTVTGLLGGVSPENYVKQNLGNYVESLKEVFHKQRIDFVFDEVTVGRLGEEITEYLQKHEDVSVTSSYTAEALGFSGARNGDYTRPFTLLRKVAKKSRQEITVRDSSKRVIPVPPVAVWDIVGGDRVLALSGASIVAAARAQLFEIERIFDRGPSPEGCQALITLLRSGTVDR